MFSLCAALAICCESFRTTVLQTSKAPHHADMTSREAEGTPARAPHFCLHVRACPGLRGLCQCRFPHDQICVCCREGGECVWLKMSFLWEVGNKDTNSTMSGLYRTRGPGMCGRKHQDYHCSCLFFLKLQGGSGRAPLHVSTVPFGSSSHIIHNATVPLGRLWMWLQIRALPLL